MPEVGRYAKMTAKSGAGEALASVMLRVAETLADAPGCEL